jgi:hypothetical protein
VLSEKVASTACAKNTPLLKSASALSSQEKINYGETAKAWVIKTQQEKTFRVIISATEIAKSGKGGEVQFTIALGNMNTYSYNDKLGKVWIVASDSSTPLELLYDKSNTLNLAPGKYWVGKATKTIKDYSATTIGVMLVNGTDLHRQGCIPMAINLNEVINGISATPTATLSPTSSTTVSPTASATSSVGLISKVKWVIPNGFSAQYVPATYAGLQASTVLNAGMYIYRFNVDGTKTWKIYTIEDADTVLAPGVGYYVYNPGDSTSIDLDEDASYKETVVLRKGWNLLANSTSGAINLATQSFPVINSTADNTCGSINTCFTTKTLTEAVTDGRVYGKSFLIVDKTATDASVAFAIINIDAASIASASVPLTTPYWIYISS